MATLREYFIKDGSSNLTLDQKWEMKDETGKVIDEVTARVHFDFEAYAQYISFYIPKMESVELPEAIVLNAIPQLLKVPLEEVHVEAGVGDERTEGKNLVFTGQVYLYSERPVKPEYQQRLSAEASALHHRLTFRSTEYMEARNRWERPLAFISHDSRDKKDIAEPLALQLQKWMCPVWFDQYSLRVGDSLREAIETGLKECPKCILLLTPNFLDNNGWTKREYDSIFTRELVEKQRVILPVWHQVTAEDVFAYSPILADRVGAQWSEGVEETARKLLRVIQQT
ncbi:toll/interleukin-1 receptor domain-containing protein [Xanthobacteraceae bacterium Astr-EGSB]|uniref:toll/interleukin-1 receptor domain-containing protein n=1 Tax=Astrobacterium formosum TaxID=3069710 RepID=UPI0027B41D69|nr:toll/interleukin-1 receptor domain-containing protein [Xanthobacteraceae bacterium Astr-EGSB]